MKKILLATVALIALGAIAPASAADLGRPYSKAPTPMIAAIYDWTGFYLGLNGGGGSSRECWTNTSLGVAPTIPNVSEGCHNATGAVAGGQVGYRWQASNWVFGVEAQGDGANFKGSNTSLFQAGVTDQTKINDFKPFGQAMTKITNRTVDKAFEIYLSLYQAVTGTEEDQNIYKQFSPDFFDLIVVDECHRGSAADDAAWRKVLTYFSSATQIGMTATPKETEHVSNIEYFGDPLYTYSLRQGIDDGYLAPIKWCELALTRISTAGGRRTARRTSTGR